MLVPNGAAPDLSGSVVCGKLKWAGWRDRHRCSAKHTYFVVFDLLELPTSKCCSQQAVMSASSF